MDAGYGAEVGAMNDRELLERASKAAGITLAWSSNEDQSPRNTDGWNVWNPLADDGDALRLAVKVAFINPGCFPRAGDEMERMLRAGVAPDWNAATRRAIVRAAAEIGRTK